MKIIDTRTGKELKVGEEFWGNELLVKLDGTAEQRTYWYLIRQLDEKLLSARVLVSTNRNPEPQWIPLIVRYLHPSFLFQKIGFFPS